MSYLDVYNQIKSLESIFTPPADYVTIDVGTFDAATGAFSGLITTIETDPEPLPHGPNQKPLNPKPHFVGQTWLSVTIDSNWLQTVTSIPAPKVGLAPVLLKFSIANHASDRRSAVLPYPFPLLQLRRCKVPRLRADSRHR